MTEKAGTVIGAAQKDTAREIGAKLSSLKGIVWLGAGLFVFGLATRIAPKVLLPERGSKAGRKDTLCQK